VPPLVAAYVVGVRAVGGALKEATARPRPDALHHASFAFPSLHTASAVFFAGALAAVLVPALADDLDDGELWRWTSGSAVAVAVAGGATAYGRILTESHWLTDTAGGAALGVAALGVGALLAPAPAGSDVEAHEERK
jgi:membrane-associated phospholipid phosphatase